MIELNRHAPGTKPGTELQCGLLDRTEEFSSGRLLEMARWKVTGRGVRLIALQQGATVETTTICVVYLL